MNITLDKQDELNNTIIIDVEKPDYTEKVEKELRKMQKNMAIKGFRPGKAPMDMVRRMYGKSVLADKIEHIATDALNEYLTENKLDVLGYPLTSAHVESDLDIEGKESFRFAFDIGLAPQFSLNISDKDSLELYQIEVTDKDIDEDIENARKRYGKMEDVEKAEADDIIYGNLTELDEAGAPLEGGISEKPASFVASMVTDEALKNSLNGLEKGAVMTLNIFQLFNNNDTVISNTLGIPKEGVNDLNMDFSLTVTEIKRRTTAEINEEFYKEVFGPEDYPANEEEYRQRIKMNLENYYRNEADMWLDHQIGHLLIEKHAMQLPDEFLKRWLVSTKGENYTTENIDEKYEQEKTALHRRLIIDKIAAENNIEPTEADIRDEARIYFYALYRQYGLTMIPDDNFLNETINKRLADREFVHQMADKVIYRKAYDKAKEIISLKNTPISVEDYFKLVNSHKHEHAE